MAVKTSLSRKTQSVFRSSVERPKLSRIMDCNLLDATLANWRQQGLAHRHGPSLLPWGLLGRTQSEPATFTSLL